jgi:hypothetical protein
VHVERDVQRRSASVVNPEMSANSAVISRRSSAAVATADDDAAAAPQ